MSVAGAAAAPEPSSILIKAFELLRSFSPERRMMSLTEIARASGLPKSTVHRLLDRLVDLDAVERHSEGYCVSLQMSQLGALTPAGHGRDTALPHLAWLHRATRCNVRYGVLRALEVVYLERMILNAHEHESTVGSRLPANCTAIGKALLAWADRGALAAELRRTILPAMTPLSHTAPGRLLAELDEIRRDGLAHERDEAQTGWSCVGAPIVVKGHAVAAISLQHPTRQRIDRNVEDAVRVTATRISLEFAAALADESRERYFPYASV
jgi:DNA-binding IclR family transcriptional regulator